MVSAKFTSIIAPFWGVRGSFILLGAAYRFKIFKSSSDCTSQDCLVVRPISEFRCPIHRRRMHAVLTPRLTRSTDQTYVSKGQTRYESHYLSNSLLRSNGRSIVRRAANPPKMALCNTSIPPGMSARRRVVIQPSVFDIPRLHVCAKHLTRILFSFFFSFFGIERACMLYDARDRRSPSGIVDNYALPVAPGLMYMCLSSFKDSLKNFGPSKMSQTILSTPQNIPTKRPRFVATLHPLWLRLCCPGTAHSSANSN